MAPLLGTGGGGCQTQAPMQSPIDPPTRGLRLGGFMASALGSLLLGIGCVMTWVVVHLKDDTQGTLDQRYPGVDLWQGKVALACAVVMLIGVFALRRRRSAGGRTGIAWLLIATAVLAMAVSVLAALTEASRLETSAVDGMAEAAAAQLRIAQDEARSQVEALAGAGIESTTEPGVFLAIAGGVMATLGGSLGLAWAMAQAAPAPQERSEPPVDDDPLTG